MLSIINVKKLKYWYKLEQNLINIIIRYYLK